MPMMNLKEIVVQIGMSRESIAARKARQPICFPSFLYVSHIILVVTRTDYVEAFHVLCSISFAIIYMGYNVWRPHSPYGEFPFLYSIICARTHTDTHTNTRVRVHRIFSKILQ